MIRIKPRRIRIKGILRLLNPVIHILAHRMHDRLSRLSLAREIRIVACIENMVSPLRCYDAAGKDEKILLLIAPPGQGSPCSV